MRKNDLVYLWHYPENITNKSISLYDKEHCVDRFIFMEAKEISEDIGPLVFYS